MKTFREIALVEEQTYEDWNAESKKLNAEVDKADVEINKAAGKTNGGLVSDEVRQSKEYKTASSNYNKAFKALQNFNKLSPKAFMKRQAKEYRANRGR